MVDVASTIPMWMQVIITLQLVFSKYWFAAFPILAAVIPMVLVRTFAFPLLTRNPTELVVIFGPTKAYVIRRISTALPFFFYKKNLYWFGEPVPVGHNMMHIYIEGVNQPLTELDRNNQKEEDILSLREFSKQTAGHTIILPPSMKSFIREWVLIVGNGKAELKPKTELKIKGKLRYKIGILKRIGLFMAKEVEAESQNSSSNANQELQLVTMQMIEQKVGKVSKGTNFGSRFAYKIIHRARYLETNWTRILLGDFDWKIIMIILAVIAVFVLIFFVIKPGDVSSIGPPPAGVPTS